MSRRNGALKDMYRVSTKALTFKRRFSRLNGRNPEKRQTSLEWGLHLGLQHPLRNLGSMLMREVGRFQKQNKGDLLDGVTSQSTENPPTFGKSNMLSLRGGCMVGNILSEFHILHNLELASTLEWLRVCPSFPLRKHRRLLRRGGGVGGAQRNGAARTQLLQFVNAKLI